MRCADELRADRQVGGAVQMQLVYGFDIVWMLSLLMQAYAQPDNVSDVATQQQKLEFYMHLQQFQYGYQVLVSSLVSRVPFC